MLVATNQDYAIKLLGHQSAANLEQRLSLSGSMASKTWRNYIARIVYFLNATIVLLGLGFVAINQKNGSYRCNQVSIRFGEEIWENAALKGDTEKHLLIYSSFNGVYIG